MKLYISARYGRRPEAEGVARMLQDAGHEITSRWVWRDQPQDYETATHEEVGEFAMEDLEDVCLAQGLVALSEPSDNPWGRGGRHVELGYALGLRKEVFVVGPLENIFHYLLDVVVTDTVPELIEYLRETENGS